MALNIVILAAGKGTRMKSRRPKVLHQLAGRSLLQHVLDAAQALQAECTVVVTGHGADEVESAARQGGARPGLRFVRQQPPRGTGDAVKQALPALDEAAATTLVLNGDVPLISPATLRGLVEACAGSKLALLTIALHDPTGYGRIVREADAVRAIVEERDASPAQRALHEVYTGFMAAPTAALKRWVSALQPNNAQGEYYLTDVVVAAVADGTPVVAAPAGREAEVLGINSPQQLAALERLVQREQADALMEAGVRLADPARLDVRGRLHCGQDVEIDVGCVFEGEVSLGDGVRVGPYSILRDVTVGAGTEIRAYCHLEGARVGADDIIGPYARLRPGAVLGDEVHIGNFVEVKNATLSHGAKANHLAYLGDATVGARVNFGAGSITANYDGANKHHTTIGADVHVGSNCVLIAPLEIGDGATVGGGSTIARNVPADTLAVARARQVSIERWKRPVKGEPPRGR